MTNKDKSREDREKPENKQPRYTALLESEKAQYLEKMVKLYPKHPKPLLEMILRVYEKELYGTDEEREHIKNTMDNLKARPDLSYFGKNGFQEEIVENKGFTVERTIRENLNVE
jgi:hypothetical protein